MSYLILGKCGLENIIIQHSLRAYPAKESAITPFTPPFPSNKMEMISCLNHHLKLVVPPFHFHGRRANL
jgi:hypothetical protein